METRQIELSLDTARRLYEQGGEYRNIALTSFKEHELIGNRLPKTWDEYCAKHGEAGDKIKASLNTAYTTINKYIFSDYKQVQAYIALIKLHLLRDEYRQGWKPDWKDAGELKYLILKLGNKLDVIEIRTTQSFLTFQDDKRAYEFLINFRDLIEEAGDLV